MGASRASESSFFIKRPRRSILESLRSLSSLSSGADSGLSGVEENPPQRADAELHCTVIQMRRSL